jgi:hypothetical protein
MKNEKVENNNSQEKTQEIPFLETFQANLQNGILDANLNIYFDLVRERYILIDKASKKRKELTAQGADKKISEVLIKNGEDVKKSTKLLKYIKNINLVFDFDRLEYSWKDDTDRSAGFINDFDIGKTKLGLIYDIANKEKKGGSDLFGLRQKCPYTYLLLSNLLEYNDEYVAYFINYIATFIHTRQKIRTAIMFSGIEGAGKGILIDNVLAPIFGYEYTANILASMLKREFNSMLENKLIVNFNEFSSDFHAQDSATQQLKSIITDNTLVINNKGVKEYAIKNCFLVFLSQNYKNSVKISVTDRRFSVFSQNLPLNVAVRDKFDIDMDTFVKRLQIELPKFCYFLARYDYDAEKANRPIMTDTKSQIQSSTNNNLYLIETFIKTLRIKELKQKIEERIELYEIYEENDKNGTDDRNRFSFSPTFREYMKTWKDRFKEFQRELELLQITNSSLIFLYTMLVSDNADTSTLGKVFSSMFGEPRISKFGGKTKRVRDVKLAVRLENQFELSKKIYEDDLENDESVPF